MHPVELPNRAVSSNNGLQAVTWHPDKLLGQRMYMTMGAECITGGYNLSSRTKRVGDQLKKPCCYRCCRTASATRILHSGIASKDTGLHHLQRLPELWGR